jgi:AraC-like DNA-binding protein
MYFDFNSESVPLLIFLVNGFIFSLLLFKKGFEQDNQSSKWLGIYIFLSSLYLFPWTFGHAKWYFVQPYRDFLFYLPTQQVLLMGPVIYFYTQSLLNPSFKIHPKMWWHLLLAFTYLAYSLLVFVVDKLILDIPYFYADNQDKDLSNWYQQIGWISMVIYAIMSISYYNGYRRLIYENLSYADSINFAWVRRYLIVFILIQILLGLFLFLYPEWGSFSNKWWYYLLFSILSFYIAIEGYVNASQAGLGFNISKNLFSENIENTINIEFTEQKDLKANINLEEWKPKILELIEKDELYRNPRLALNDFAEKLQTNPTIISKAVNQCFDMNFNDFVNHYRIEAMKTMFEQKTHQKHTLLGIALDCGFNSKTTFNRAFKKNTGLSPKEYLDSIE